jgi:hypothetical protein
MKKYDYLIVGSGLFGATFANLANKAGKKVLVIDKREHIAGNIYTENVEGINVHKYGAHIFHTDYKDVWDYVNSFVEFNRYTNSPVARIGNEIYNMPFNMNTFSKIWNDVFTPEDALRHINEERKEMEEADFLKKNSVTKNYIYNFLYQILTIIIPLITTPYLSRVLGAENIGIYSFTISITTYFILFGSLGVAMYGQREIAYVQNDIKKRSKIFFEIFFMRCITLGISLFIFYITFCSKGQYNIYYKILILEIIANAIDISWYFQGLEEFKKTVMRNTIVKLISVICIFVFVKESTDLNKYFIIYVLSTFLGNLSLWMYLPRFVQMVKFNIKFTIAPITTDNVY